jgi:hypothetical protein
MNCGVCGIAVENLLRLKQHQFAEHYDYVLLHCNDDKELLKQWVEQQ